MMFGNENMVFFPHSSPYPAAQKSVLHIYVQMNQIKLGWLAYLTIEKIKLTWPFFHVRNGNEILLSQIKIATIFIQMLMLNHIFRHPHKYFKEVSIYKQLHFFQGQTHFRVSHGKSVGILKGKSVKYGEEKEAPSLYVVF